MGDGEVCGTAVETAMDITVRLTTRTDMSARYPQYAIPEGQLGATERPPRSNSVWLATNTGTTGSAAMYTPLIAPHMPSRGDTYFAHTTPRRIPGHIPAI